MDNNNGNNFNNNEQPIEQNNYWGNEPQQPVRPQYNAMMQSTLEEPVSMKEWFITYLLLMIPCVNIVMPFVWAFSKTEKKSKSNFFKLQLLILAIILVIYIVFAIVMVVAGVGFGAAANSMMSTY